METTSCVKFLKSYKQDILGRETIEVEKIDYDLRTALIPFLPENALDEVVAMLQKYPICLNIAPCLNEEKGTRGLFHYGSYGAPHTISIKNDLDKDTFLEVFLHEYAHLLTHLSFSNFFLSHHGYEFHFCFCKLIREFFKKNIISEDLSYFKFNGSFTVGWHHLQDEVQTWKSNEYHNKILAWVSNCFYLKTIRVGSQFEYEGEVFERVKGQQGKIRCTRVSDGMIFQLEPETYGVNPVLDLCRERTLK